MKITLIAFIKLISFRGESAVGKWTVIVKDNKVNEYTGSFIDWRLNLWGEAIDASSQELHPLPEEDDDDHTIEDAVAAITSVTQVPTQTKPLAPPAEATNRPVNQKPTQTTSSPETTSDVDTSPDTAADTSPSPSSTGTFLPSFFPTFGASKRTQVWIYASMGMIIVFCIGLGVYFQLQRRKRIRNNPRDDYEFEMIEDEDELHAAHGPSGRTQRRGGELYNAFAGESDEELFSDDDEKPLYTDRPGSHEGSDRDYHQYEKS